MPRIVHIRVGQHIPSADRHLRQSVMLSELKMIEEVPIEELESWLEVLNSTKFERNLNMDPTNFVCNTT